MKLSNYKKFLILISSGQKKNKRENCTGELAILSKKLNIWHFWADSSEFWFVCGRWKRRGNVLNKLILLFRKSFFNIG